MNAQDDFDLSRYRVNEPKKVSQTPGNDDFDLNKYRVQGASKPGFIESLEIPRHVARTGSRVAETIAGMPGDFIKTVEAIGEVIPKGPDFLQKEPNFVQRAGKAALQKVPGQQELQRASQNATQGYTAPQGPREQMVDEVASFTAALAGPTKNIGQVKNWIKSLGMAIGAKAVGEGAKQLGAGPKEQVAAELGTLVLLSTYKPKAAKDYIGKLYDEARAAIPEGTMVNTGEMLSDLNSFENVLKKGTSTPSKDVVLKQLNEVKQKAAGGAMPLDDLVESFHSINENIGAKKLFDELGSSQKKLTKSRFDVLKNSIRDTINENPVPGFTDKWNSANQGFHVLEDSRRISNWVSEKLPKIPDKLTGSLAIELITGHPQLVVSTAGATTAVKGIELLEQVARSPVLRQAYLKTLEAATQENLPAFINNLQNLDKEIKKNQSSQK